MTALSILLAALIVGETPAPPPAVTVCSPPGPKKPSLMLVDSKGKCAPGYRGIEDKSSKDKKVMYCVNTEHPQPAECKPTKVPGSK